jgi:hypothetical protein
LRLGEAAIVFSLRRLSDGGYVIDARWRDGRTEQLIGVFISELFARRVLRNLQLTTPLNLHDEAVHHAYTSAILPLNRDSRSQY